MPQLIYPGNRAEWLALRTMDVTSTESSALFGLNPWVTEFELWHQKKDGTVVEIEENERMSWGLTLEPFIAKRIAELYGVKVRRLSAYARHDDVRMGASFDYEIVGIVHGEVEDTILQRMYEQHGPGNLEIKNVDGLVFRDQWVTEGQQIVEAPPRIEIQVQHQLEVIQRNWSAIGVLVGGNTLRMLIRERDKAVGRSLRFKIGAFWDSIIENRPPEIDFNRDAAFVAKLFGHAEPGKFIDLRDNNRAAELAAEYHAAAQDEKAAKDRKEAAKAELLTIIGDAEKAAIPGFTISAGVVAEAEISYTRKAYRNFRLTARKEKAK